MNDTTPRVALLARAGTARDCVRGALLEIGADVVVEADPASVEPDAIRSAAPRVVMVVLDAVAEDALGRLDDVLADPGIEVMFEEAEIAAAREGWEAARWRRHLAAKLLHRGDVLPPVAGAGVVAAVDPLSVQLEDLIASDEDGLPPLVAAEPIEAPAGGSDFSIFDPVAAEAALEPSGDFVLTLEGLELEGAGGAALPPVTGPDFAASDFDPLLAELDAQLPEPAPLPATDWDGGLVESFDVTEAAETTRAATGQANEAATGGFGELSLADDVAPVGGAAAGGARFSADLDDLERRISSLSLVDDAPAPGSAFASAAAVTPGADASSAIPARGAPGAVLVLAGIGGPDAVRQFLGGLPAGFGRAVLIRQRLDGARYDKLVAQMQRATSLPVALADAGGPVLPGHVYILGDDVGLADTGGLVFVADGGASLLDRLPAGESAVIVLSGADPALANEITALRQRGAFVGAQTDEGCYDAAAATAVAERGAMRALPSELARQLDGRWSS
ncbi:chemotaxis protein CheB [Lysobacter humi (ex Lee et al. 2017)]